MNFQRGVPPVESDMGVVCHNTRRPGGSLIFDMWQLSVQVNVQNAARSIRLPRFRIRAYFGRFLLVAIFESAKEFFC
jgi:hypothetical protein